MISAKTKHGIGLDLKFRLMRAQNLHSSDVRTLINPKTGPKLTLKGIVNWIWKLIENCEYVENRTQVRWWALAEFTRGNRCKRHKYTRKIVNYTQNSSQTNFWTWIFTLKHVEYVGAHNLLQMNWSGLDTTDHKRREWHENGTKLCVASLKEP